MRQTRSALGTCRLFACSAAVLLWSLAALRAAPLQAQPAPSEAFVECDRQELIRAVPELASMQFDSAQDRLPGLLAPAAEELGGHVRKAGRRRRHRTDPRDAIRGWCGIAWPVADVSLSGEASCGRFARTVYRTAGRPRPQRSHAGSCRWLPGRRAL